MHEYFKTRSLKLNNFIDGDIDSRVYLNDHFSPAAGRLNAKKLIRKDVIKKFKILNSDKVKAKITMNDNREVVYGPAECADLLI